jgi:flagellar basal body-associated protein FliL
METQQQTASPKAGTSKGSNTALIIIIIAVAVVVLGVGGYFGYKYLSKKYLTKTTGVVATATVTTKTGTVSLKSVVDSLLYPGAAIADQKQEKDGVYKAELTLSSADSVNTIKAYYQKLTADKKWNITRQGTSGADNYYMTTTDGVFTAEIDVTKYPGYDTTDIRIQISGDNLTDESIVVSPITARSSAVSTSTTTTVTTVSGDYVIRDSNSRVISESELTSLTPWLLKVARNEIYARHGRDFVHRDLQCYFAKKAWYSVDLNYSESSLSTTENKNVATILAYEQKISSPLLQTDSGCDTNS